MHKLSILIPSLQGRKRLLDKLLSDLDLQIKGRDVQVLTDVDKGQVSVGSKRHRLLQSASGDYSVFIDDDDKIADNYIEEILKAIESEPDCVTYRLHYLTKRGGDAIPVDFDLRYKKDSNSVIPFERIPNHLCPVRTIIAKQISFKAMKYGEDADYAFRLKPYLKTQRKIEKTLYYYLDYYK